MWVGYKVEASRLWTGNIISLAFKRTNRANKTFWLKYLIKIGKQEIEIFVNDRKNFREFGFGYRR